MKLSPSQADLVKFNWRLEKQIMRHKVKSRAMDSRQEPQFRRWIKGRRGRTTGQGIWEWLFYRLIQNELLPASERQTDAAIDEDLVDEFPAVQKELQENSRSHLRSFRRWTPTINAVRWKFNTGNITRGARPGVVSFRYDNQGIRCWNQNPKRIMTKDEHQQQLDWWDLWWKGQDLNEWLKIQAKYDSVRDDHPEELPSQEVVDGYKAQFKKIVEDLTTDRPKTLGAVGRGAYKPRF